MDYYLIDYENTGENGLRGITELPENSCVVIFYSENADKISFDMHQKFCICKTKLEFRKINTGRKNALDFQLSTYLGYLIAKSEEDQYYIVSKDNGYRSVVDFWRDKKVRQIDFIARITSKPLLTTTARVDDDVQEAAEDPETDVTVEDELLETESLAAEIPAGVPETEADEEEDGAGDSYEEEALTSEEPKAAEELTSEEPVAEKEAVIEKPTIEEPTIEETSEEEKMTAEKEASSEIVADSEDEPVQESVISEETAGTASTEEKPQPESRPQQKKPQQKKSQKVKKQSEKKHEPLQPEELQPTEELRASVSEVIDDAEAVEHICRFIVKYKTKQGVNNAIVKIYGTEKAGELYKKIKPLLKDKKGK